MIVQEDTLVMPYFISSSTWTEGRDSESKMVNRHIQVSSQVSLITVYHDHHHPPLSHVYPILRTGAPSDGQKPIEYTIPSLGVSDPPPGTRRRNTARHSDSDTSPTPTHRRGRSHPTGTPPEHDGKEFKAERATPDPFTPIFIPARWHANYHSPFLTMSSDGLSLTYTSAGGHGDRDAATALASHPIPPHVGVYYYEVEVQDKGLNGYISIGLCKQDMPLGRLPGWEYGSWGYHGDDGHAFTGTHADTDYGPKFSTGDTIGCGVDFTTGAAFYTKNGLMIGPIFPELTQHGPLWPCVGLRSPNECIKANFGQKDFLFDVDGYVRRRKDTVLREVEKWAVRALPLSVSAAVKLEDEDAPGGGNVVVRFTGGPKAAEDALFRRRARRLTLGAASERTPKKSSKRESIASRAAVDSSAAEDGKKGHKASNSVVSLSAGAGKGVTGVERSEEDELRMALDALVLDYLAHQALVGSVHALARESATRDREDGVPGEAASVIGMDISRPASAMDVDVPSTSTTEAGIWNLPMNSIRARREITTHILAGSIDPAMELIALHWPGLLRTRAVQESAIEEDPTDGEAEKEVYSELSCRLECRKFVELVLAYSASPLGSPISPVSTAYTIHAGQNPPSSPPASPSIPAPTPPSQELDEAFSFGRVLHHRYSDAANPEMRALVSRTFSLLGFARPEEAGGDLAVLVGPGAREELAQWVNEVILLGAEGHSDRPALARAWAQTATVMAQLGQSGGGKAAFIDVREVVGGEVVFAWSPYAIAFYLHNDVYPALLSPSTCRPTAPTPGTDVAKRTVRSIASLGRLGWFWGSLFYVITVGYRGHDAGDDRARTAMGIIVWVWGNDAGGDREGGHAGGDRKDRLWGDAVAKAVGCGGVHTLIVLGDHRWVLGAREW
ncbi:SPRY-domain-containing protein [Dacryopinax primogenitus]|uniref:SPRY-domain-containing protein n=1 Tax=Dacryopinax primogenitus (strain DJM 731) TaxID=1858805 RepID=M5G5E1_DACPD|nr:SPRY-domain-containing protein [Dacryopinax primogenitus]EJT98972.1 SPRY-domain-containing protein [Dacryopinax primogenitus]